MNSGQNQVLQVIRLHFSWKSCVLNPCLRPFLFSWASGKPSHGTRERSSASTFECALHSALPRCALLIQPPRLYPSTANSWQQRWMWTCTCSGLLLLRWSGRRLPRPAHLDGQGRVQSGPLCAWTVRFSSSLSPRPRPCRMKGLGYPSPLCPHRELLCFLWEQNGRTFISRRLYLISYINPRSSNDIYDPKICLWNEAVTY